VHVVEPGVNSFIRGAVRGLAFGRQRRGVGAEMPFRLSRWPDGRLTLGDPATGSVLDLDAYGGDNRRAFASLLPKVRRGISVNPP
jgi:putative photosynthetic complex assembly protein